MKDTRAQQPAIHSRYAHALLPLDTGSRDIPQLDGLRALAALSIVAFHVYLAERFEYTTWGKEASSDFFFLATGVHLFFVLSGFLLFLPFAKAILHATPLPSARVFYKRRALRILPAYLVCLILLVMLQPRTLGINDPLFLGDLVSHLFLIHDDFPRFIQDIDGPFWTLAVEVQFYLALPLLALILSRLVGSTRSVARLSAGVGGIIVYALALRALDALVMAHLVNFGDPFRALGQIFVLATMGTLGKFLEVFAVGMMCAVLYVATVEDRQLAVTWQQRLAWLLLASAIVLIAVLKPIQEYSSPRYAPGFNMGVLGVVVPGLVGLAYGTLLLSIVWGNRFLRAPFEFYPLRFIGLISFSLYLWHVPIIHPVIPVLQNSQASAFGLLPLALAVAYLSYQFVERPFLGRRKKRAMLSDRVTASGAKQSLSTIDSAAVDGHV